MSSSPLFDTIVGPRKRRPSERVTQNGDPLSRKKVKSTKKVAPKAAQVNQRASVEGVAEPAPPICSQPLNPNRILEASDGSDDDDIGFIDMLRLVVIYDNKDG